MSGNSLSDSNDWQNRVCSRFLSIDHDAPQPAGSFDDGVVDVDYQDTDYFGSTEGWWQHSAHCPALCSTPVSIAPDGYYDTHFLPSEHVSNTEHDIHLAQPDNVYAPNAPVPLSETTEQQSRSLDQAYYTHDHSACVPTYALGLDSTYSPPSYIPNQSFPSSGIIDPNWTDLPSAENHEVFYPALGIPSVVPSQFPSPQSVAPVVHPALIHLQGPVPSLLESECQVTGSQAQVVQGPKPKRRCSICGKEFDPKPSNWNRHRDMHTQTKGYKCTECGMERVTKDQVVVHYIRHHMHVSYDSYKDASHGEQRKLRAVAHQYVNQL
ncbi:unnamed protein product [Rhizoctonia solani]|uniref:C2H2-type domain-containing protein n=1 Tax=Rhizoctonia solani TaxID=456999 RepID=A0A8H2XBI0_9AGAM|nr:unnamed protein product [Rhizoctonia solani]